MLHQGAKQYRPTRQAGNWLMHALVVAVALVWSQGSDARQYSMPLFLPASDSAQQSFARIINLSDETGDVTIVAVDESGRRSGPIKFTRRLRYVRDLRRLCRWPLEMRARRS